MWSQMQSSVYFSKESKWVQTHTTKNGSDVTLIVTDYKIFSHIHIGGLLHAHMPFSMWAEKIILHLMKRSSKISQL